LRKRQNFSKKNLSGKLEKIQQDLNVPTKLFNRIIEGHSPSTHSGISLHDDLLNSSGGTQIAHHHLLAAAINDNRSNGVSYFFLQIFHRAKGHLVYALITGRICSNTIVFATNVDKIPRVSP
jgi:hypothetical protein